MYFPLFHPKTTPLFHFVEKKNETKQKEQKM